LSQLQNEGRWCCSRSILHRQRWRVEITNLAKLLTEARKWKGKTDHGRGLELAAALQLMQSKQVLCAQTELFTPAVERQQTKGEKGSSQSPLQSAVKLQQQRLKCNYLRVTV
jgi:hypothetical protein